jgi:hypothetical protein
MSESRGFVFRRNSMAYVYGHYKADTGELFYIGKGVRNRAWSHYCRNKHWNNVVNKHGLEVKILYDGLTDEEAYEKERELIAEVGLQNLTNIMEGGEGPTSAGIRRMFEDPEYRQKIADANREKAKDPEWRKKQKEGVRKVMQDPEWGKKHKEGCQKNVGNIEKNKKISAGVKSYWDNNPDDDRNKRIAQDPEWQKKQKEGIMRVTQDPEWRRKQKEGIRLYWENKRKLKQTET